MAEHRQRSAAGNIMARIPAQRHWIFEIVRLHAEPRIYGTVYSR